MSVWSVSAKRDSTEVAATPDVGAEQRREPVRVYMAVSTPAEIYSRRS